MKKTSVGFKKAILFLFVFAFGMVALAVLYQAATQSTEQRSKAAGEKRSIYKAWEFNTDNNTEGWTGSALGLSVKKGLLWGTPLSIVEKRSLPTLRYSFSSGNLSLPTGKKYLKVVLAGVTSAPVPRPTTTTPAAPRPSAFGKIICPQDTKLCPNGAYVGRVGPQCVFAPCPGGGSPVPTPSPLPAKGFSFQITYTGKGTSGKPLPIQQGFFDGVSRSYDIAFPETLPFGMNTIDITFIGLAGASQVQIDSIRIEGVTLPTPTPTTSSCQGKPDGTQCVLSSTPCPTCIPGKPCSLQPCAVQMGICIKEKCISLPAPTGVSGTPTPTPTPLPPTPFSSPVPVTPTPTPTSSQQACVSHGGRCESLYANCPSPDNQLPYDCGTGLRCVPADMKCT